MKSQALAERLCGDQLLELSHQRVVPPEREIRIDPKLESRAPDLLQPCDRRLGERLVLEVRKRRTSPQRQRFVQALGRLGREPAGLQLPRLVHQLLEPMQVQVIALDSDDVARRPCRQHVPGECLSKSRDVHAKRIGGALRRILAPELVDQPVRRDHLVRVDEKQREQRPLLGSAQRDLARIVPYLERPENPESHRGAPERVAIRRFSQLSRV